MALFIRKKNPRKDAQYYDVPDKGYAWVVLLANMLLHAILSGCFIIYALIVVEYLEYFRQTKSVTSWIGAILLLCNGTMALLGGQLIKRYGYRFTTILGTLLVTSGYVLSSMAPNVYCLYFTHGIIAGTGYAQIVVASTVAVQCYFKKHRGLACALATSGVGIGAFFWSPLTRWLLKQFPWQQTLVLLGGINFHGLLFASLLRPPRFSIVAADSARHDQQRNDKNYQNQALLIENNTNNTNSQNCAITIKPVILSSKDVTYSVCVKYLESVKFLNVEQERENNLQKDQNEVNMKDELLIETADRKSDEIFQNLSVPVEHFTDSEKAFRLLDHPDVIVFYIAVFFSSCSHLIPYTFTPLRALGLGLSKDDGALLLSVLGFCGLLTRGIFGYLGDRGNRLLLYAVGNIIAGGVTSLSVLARNKVSLLVYMVFYGISAASYISVQPTILSDLVGMQNLPHTTGQSIAVIGLALFLSTQTVGHLFDIFTDVGLPFLVTGFIHMVGGLAGVALIIIHNRKRSHKSPAT